MSLFCVYLASSDSTLSLSSSSSRRETGRCITYTQLPSSQQHPSTAFNIILLSHDSEIDTMPFHELWMLPCLCLWIELLQNQVLYTTVPSCAAKKPTFPTSFCLAIPNRASCSIPHILSSSSGPHVSIQISKEDIWLLAGIEDYYARSRSCKTRSSLAAWLAAHFGAQCIIGQHM